MKTSFSARVYGIQPHCKIAFPPRAPFEIRRGTNRLLALTERSFSGLPEEEEEEEEEEEKEKRQE